MLLRDPTPSRPAALYVYLFQPLSFLLEEIWFTARAGVSSSNSNGKPLKTLLKFKEDILISYYQHLS